MTRSPARKDLSLKGLELFQICAVKGSVQAVARETGLSVSTVSHHLRNLEDHLGIDLFDHTRRPMVLTPKGQVFLRNIDDALLSIRKAKAEARAGDISEASYVRLGAIEDFDSDIIPELAVQLANTMPNCDFTYCTDTSQAIIDMLHDRQLDLGITGSPTERMRDLQDRPLLHDPFVVVLPRTSEEEAEEIITGRTRLPFLRFTGNLMIARQIEGQLRRIGVAVPNRFECGSSQTLLAMVASGGGWTITTPLLFARARRFQPKLRMCPFPGKGFGRKLAVVSTPDCSRSILEMVDLQMRALIDEHIIIPICQVAPWLDGNFRLIE
ncbi:MAG: LysR family transcriptional regulator [Pseudomonadota bacterium]